MGRERERGRGMAFEFTTTCLSSRSWLENPCHRKRRSSVRVFAGREKGREKIEIRILLSGGDRTWSAKYKSVCRIGVQILEGGGVFPQATTSTEKINGF